MLCRELTYAVSATTIKPFHIPHPLSVENIKILIGEVLTTNNNNSKMFACQ